MRQTAAVNGVFYAVNVFKQVVFAARLCRSMVKSALIRAYCGGNFIFIDDRHVALISEGEGEDLLFLHGYLSCKESFYYNLSYFKRYYRVTAPDFPGFGASAPLCSAWSVSDYADWLSKFIGAAGLKRPSVIAHSFGARVVFRYAAEHPGCFNKIVICGGAGIVKPRTRAYRRRVAAYRFIKKFAPAFAERAFGSAEYRSLSPIMRQSYKKIVNEDLLACAAQVTSPVLLVYGKNDTVTPIGEEGKAFNSAISGSALLEMEGGHFCFSQNYNLFNKEVRAFLAGEAQE